MPRLSKKYKEEMAFFINDKGRIEYNKLCKGCQKECKQSFRAMIIQCPIYEKKGGEENGK